MKEFIGTSRNVRQIFKKIEEVFAEHKTFSIRTFYTPNLRKALGLHVKLQGSDAATKSKGEYLTSHRLFYSNLRAVRRPKKSEEPWLWDGVLIKIGEKKSENFIRVIYSGDKIFFLDEGIVIESQTVLNRNKHCLTIISPK